jgi:hypothetical protein
MRLAEKKAGYSGIQGLSDRDFELISNEIFDKTRVKISIATLKRIKGRVKTDSDYIPQESTLDALAVYLDYQNWGDFCQRKKKPVKIISIILASLLVITLTTILLIQNNPCINPARIKFSSRNNIGQAPLTVNFFYDISQYKNQPFHLDFGNQETKLLNPTLKTVNHLYANPWFHIAFLKSHDKTIRETTVHVLSEGWKAFYVTNHKSKKILLPVNPVNNGKLDLSEKTINSLLGKTAYEKSWIFYVNSNNFGFECDNILLHTRIRNNSSLERETNCNFGDIRLLGEKGILRFRTGNPGGGKWIKIWAGEKFINGEYNNLSQMCADMTDWVDIRAINKNQQVEIIINERPVYYLEYKNTIGKLKVIVYDFTGTGEVDYINITSHAGDTLYFDDFSN